MTSRADIVRVARSYLRTPFHHLARKPGVGLDCAGVLICVARELGLVPLDFDVPNYARRPDGHSMIEWCDQYMTPVTREAMQPGDAIVLIVDRDPQHLGIIGDYPAGGHSIIHAASRNDGSGKVIETRLQYARNLQFVAAYQFPGIA